MPRQFIFLINLLFSSFLFAGPLVVGTTSYYPPFEMVANNKNALTGFDIDLMKEICTRINRSCSFKVYLFDELFPELMNNKIDASIAGITITTARSDQFLFSLPYLASSGQFIVPTASKSKNLNDLNGKRIGVEHRSLFKELASKTLNAATTVVEYKTQPDLLQGLGNNEVDAALLDTATAEYWVANNSNLFKLIGNNIDVGLGYGIMANKTNFALINSINNALLSMENDGTYLRLYNLYFQTLLLSTL
ncbi:MAG: hypothetical protein A3F46_06110 [Legionellales bacterium RIFCSPHIGHO2_12_FULL_42_9]|nr:MAG: hypothetical protein A3F46_06110 [Legionellales bacterium RIFCSPHIGHO2_12_FULL_42_9]